MVLIGRILNSKKALYAMVPVVVNAVASFGGADLTQPAIVILDAAFALLIVAQTVLDLRFGSASDGTVAK